MLEPTSLDLVTQAGAALDQVLLDNVYETLLTATPRARSRPGLTELPEISEDGLDVHVHHPGRRDVPQRGSR